ncbi:AAA family ATPase [Candidatus Methanomassiliicoccus intestinalis]|uniref:AAA family ATPase n=1 Tax=Candidatus Methanomassiliicoccus intestinalis TaxID=1406512 RepID=UPI0037DD98AD
MSSESLNRTIFFPFSAIYGMNDAKKALICALVNPQIKSVLIRGPSGVAKTTVVRAITECIPDKKLINVPLNATEEQIFGGINIEKTLKNGVIEEEVGLLLRSNENIAYIDDINLFDSSILISILNMLHANKLIVEREGISSSHDFNGLLIGTMNPADSDLSSHILDRFDICICINEEDDIAAKEEILRRNLEFDNDPVKFRHKYHDEETTIIDTIEKAKKLLPYVTISDDLISIIVELCINIGSEGHRGDISTLNTALTLAALNGREEVSRKDVEEAAMLCLSHRRDYTPNPPPQRNADNEDDPDTNEQSEENSQDDLPNQKNNNEKQQDDNDTPEKNDTNQSNNDIQKMDDLMFQIGNQFKLINYLGNNRLRIVKTKSRKGRRDVVESGDKTGRYARYRVPKDFPRDIAFDATIKAAAPFQKCRDKGDLCITIKDSDLREKVRERRCGCTLLFLVDASGSLGVRKRMIAVKGAILSMLKESYVKRDRIGMMAFRRDSAELILQPTKSVEYSYKMLEDLPTGGKTPLSAALMKANEYMTTYSRSHPGEHCYIVVLTDGRANVPLKDSFNANDEAQTIDDNISIPGVKWIVVDTCAGYPRFDNAEKLAEKLSATYFRLEELNAENLSQNIRMIVN